MTIDTTVTIENWDQLDAMLTLDPATSDLTQFVGAIVAADDLGTLQKRCVEKGWTLHARETGDGWYVTGIEAKRTFGKLIEGNKKDEGHYHYEIKPGTPLHRLVSPTYKTWLWQQMQAGNVDIIRALHEVFNGAWVGCDVYVFGPNASGVIAAAGYLMQRYDGETLPILAEPGKVTP